MNMSIFIFQILNIVEVFEYHLQITLNKELFKVRDLIAIEDLIEYFGGKYKEAFSGELLYIINADYFKTREQAEYFKEIFLVEYWK
jgi:hypothetical protein